VTTEGQVAIRAEALVRRFGEFTAVERLTFDVTSGEVFGLLGGNGSGKTTTIRMLTGILPPTSGRAFVGGLDVVLDPLAVRSHLGYVAQKVSLYPNLSIAENVRFYGGIYGLSRTEVRARASELAPRLGLERTDQAALAHDLPPGIRQRVAVLVALLHRPRVLFLDEPTASVDLVNRRDLFDLMHDLAREGLAVLLTSHNIDEMERCDRLGFIDRGQMIVSGNADELKESLLGGRRFAIVLRGKDPAAVGLAFREAALAVEQEEPEASGKLHVITKGEGDEKRMHQVLSQLAGVRIHYAPPTLESVLLKELARRRRASHKIGQHGALAAEGS
jgi:ABC-2 type transport system ATP-binding protein